MDDDLTAELFGDFDSADEPAAQGAKGAAPQGAQAAPAPAVALPTEEDLAAELFGDFDSGEEAAPEPSRGRLKRVQPEEGRPAEGHQRRVKRRKDISKFFEVEAEEAGASGDEDEDGDLDDLIDDSGVEVGERGRAKLRSQMQRQELEEVRRDVSSRPEAGASRVFGSSFLDRMEEKYKSMDQDMAVPGATPIPGPPSPLPSLGKRQDTNAFVVPDVKDPKLWTVKTFAPEQGLCIQLMRKAADCMSKGTKVPIYSLFYSNHLRGYIYVEAHKETDVRDFFRGITGLSVWDIKIVPTDQMPQVFVASATDADKRMLLKTGDWVRMKRGPYKGDLAQIDEVKDNVFVVKMKPRLRYGIERQNRASTREERKALKRPPPRWFNRTDVEAGGLIVNTEKRFTPKGYITFYIVDDESYRDGFVYKSYKAHWFETGDAVRPLEHELQDWRFAPPVSENTRPAVDVPKADDAKLMPPPLATPKKVSVVTERMPLFEGDVVIVHTGDLKNLRGVVTKALYGSTTVLVKPLDVANIEGELNLSINLLSKYFQVGDYVKTVSGDHEGDTGYVMKVILDEKGGWGINALARVLSTSISGEFNARIDHLRLTSQKPEAQDVVGEFAVERLVRLESRQNARGMIIRLEAGTRAIVLTTDGMKHDVALGDLEPVALPDRKTYCRNVWTIDRKGRRIMPDAIVRCPRTSGRSAPIKAEVKYIHNEFCFLKAVEALTGERAYLVCSGSKCEFVFSKIAEKQKEGPAREEAKTSGTATAQGKMSYGVVMASETSWVEPWFKKMMGIDEERGKKNSITQLGTAVRIHGGSYKGLRGEVRDYLGDKVRISLLAKPKLVVVSVSDIGPDEYEHPRSERFPKSAAAPSTPFMPLAAPATPRQPELEFGDEASADQVWDPEFLAGGPAPTTPLAEPPVPPPPTPSVGGHSTETEDASARGVLLPTKRRKPRLPRDGELASGGPPREAESVSQSPSAVFGQSGRKTANEERAQWLIVGVGVKYTRKGEACCGWILKVYADTAHVVPGSAAVGDDSEMLPLKGNETQPLPCEKRGEAVVVFAGPRRGSKGKVIGFEGDSVYVRMEHTDKGKHTLLFASAAGSDLVRVQKKDVALFDREWARAAEERRKLPPPHAAPEKPAADSDADSMAWLWKPSGEVDKQVPPKEQDQATEKPAADSDAESMARLWKPSGGVDKQALPQAPEKPAADSDAESMACLWKPSGEVDTQALPQAVPDKPAEDSDADSIAWLLKPSVVANRHALLQANCEAVVDERAPSPVHGDAMDVEASGEAGGDSRAVPEALPEGLAQAHGEAADERANCEAAVDERARSPVLGDAVDAEASAEAGGDLRAVPEGRLEAPPEASREDAE